jgi:hypothetical protein
MRFRQLTKTPLQSNSFLTIYVPATYAKCPFALLVPYIRWRHLACKSTPQTVWANPMKSEAPAIKTSLDRWKRIQSVLGLAALNGS